MSVKDIMHPATIVETDTSILEISRLMREKSVGSVLVKIDGGDHGIITERDIVISIIAKDKDPKTVKASDVMNTLLYTIDAGESIQKASEIFNLHPIRRLPVVEGGKIIGLITTRDVAKRLAFERYTSGSKFKEVSSKKWR